PSRGAVAYPGFASFEGLRSRTGNLISFLVFFLFCSFVCILRLPLLALRRTNTFYSKRVKDVKRICIADAHRGDGKRFIVRADEKLTAFVELEARLEKKALTLCRRLPESRSR